MASSLDDVMPYRFEELGSFQFQRVCRELLDLEAGFTSDEWRQLPSGHSVLASEGIVVPPSGNRLVGPTLIVVVWLRNRTSAHAANDLRYVLARAREAWRATPARSVLLLTNAAADARLFQDVQAGYLGPNELTRIVVGSPMLRLRVPSLLGICELGEFMTPELRARSSGDIEAAAELARVFIPTQAHARALVALDRHHFTVLTGPPEMGKTAIARMIGLALLSAGWAMHECIRPDELWRLYARDRKQVFIADDAFGSTEYRPEAAERWAVELDRALRTMDESHWLIWTSRPGPLKAALRRLHREHGIERFPAPAEVQVDAAKLDVAEKALILFRHTKAAALPLNAVGLVQRQGWRIVSHEHFTPERIRRFVSDRLPEHARKALDPPEIGRIVREEIREPTGAMAASFRALAPEHRAVLVALLDTPPGPVPERELVAAVRRHSHTGFMQAPSELIDRLTDHFLRVVEPAGVTWVHPSWRDLVIEELVEDGDARRKFLRDSSIEGLLLALSIGGGETGERVLPLLREDADWDALADRVGSLAAELEAPSITRLLGSLAEARMAVPHKRDELDALAAYALELVARYWNETRVVIPVGLLSLWLEVAATLPEQPDRPQLAATWIDLLPTEIADLDDDAELARFDEWTALADLLSEHAPEQLASFGFPERQQRKAIAGFVESARLLADRIRESPRRELVAGILRRLARLAPNYVVEAAGLADRLSEPPPSPFDVAAPPTRTMSPELQRILDAPPRRPRSDRALVARVLRDL
jgi:hypothetical protein